MSVQNIVDCKGHIAVGQKKDTNFFVESFFDTMNDLDPENKCVELHIFDGASVCIKAQKILKVVYHIL